LRTTDIIALPVKCGRILLVCTRNGQFLACFDRRVETKPGTGDGLKYEMDDVSRWEEGYKGLKINLEKCPRKNVELKSCNGQSRLKVPMDVGGFGNVGYVEWGART
jgi:hypothetical protein